MSSLSEQVKDKSKLFQFNNRKYKNNKKKMKMKKLLLFSLIKTFCVENSLPFP